MSSQIVFQLLKHFYTGKRTCKKKIRCVQTNFDGCLAKNRWVSHREPKISLWLAKIPHPPFMIFFHFAFTTLLLICCSFLLFSGIDARSLVATAPLKCLEIISKKLDCHLNFILTPLSLTMSGLCREVKNARLTAYWRSLPWPNFLEIFVSGIR